MMLIHPRVFDSMRHMIPKPTIAQRSMSELEDRMQEILANKMISDEEKVKLYSDALARYSTIERNMRSKSQIETSYRNDSADGTIASVAAHQPDIKEEILQEVPKRYHDEAGQLIDIVRKGLPDVTWTPSGRMLYKNKSIPNSNLVTLISFLSDDGKANDQPPPGHRELTEALNAARVAPSLVVNNLKRRRPRSPSPTPTSTSPPPISSSRRASTSATPISRSREASKVSKRPERKSTLPSRFNPTTGQAGKGFRQGRTPVSQLPASHFPNRWLQY